MKAWIELLRDRAEQLISGKDAMEQSDIDKVEKSLIEEAFNSDFITDTIRHDFFKDFSEYLENNVDNWMTNNYGPIASICQSSGTGKSKCMFEFAKTHFCIFICARNAEHGGFPNRSPIADLLEESLNSELEAQAFMLTFISNQLNHIKNIRKRNSVVETQILDFSKIQPWFIKNDGVDKSIELLREKITKILKSETSHKKINELRKEFVKKFNKVMIDDPLFVFIDEAYPLLTGSSIASLDKFMIFRRASHEMLQGLRCLFVLAQTASIVSDFSNPYHIIASERLVTSNKKPPISPFNKVYFFDTQIPDEYRKLLHGQFGYNSLKERKPEETLFLLGRPLWPSRIKINNYDPSSVIDLARVKIILATSYAKLTDKHEFLATLALLCIRTTLMIEFSSSYGSELVANHMSILFHISNSRDRIATSYISEPILSEAAAQIMHANEECTSFDRHSKEKINLNKILNVFNNYVQRMNLVSSGEVGEIIAQLILLLAFDNARINSKQVFKNRLNAIYSYPVTVEEFLSSLLGDLKYNELKKQHPLGERFLKGLVCFTHFIRKLDDLNYIDTKVHFVGRCAAGQFKPYNESVDLFIPVILDDNTITYIFVEVKNLVDCVGIDCAHNIKAKKEYFFNNKPDDHLSLVLCLGCGKNSSIVSDQPHQIITRSKMSSTPESKEEALQHIQSPKSINYSSIVTASDAHLKQSSDSIQEKDHQNKQSKEEHAYNRYFILLHGIDYLASSFLTENHVETIQEILDCSRCTIKGSTEYDPASIEFLFWSNLTLK